MGSAPKTDCLLKNNASGTIYLLSHRASLEQLLTTLSNELYFSKLKASQGIILLMIFFFPLRTQGSNADSESTRSQSFPSVVHRSKMDQDALCHKAAPKL